MATPKRSKGQREADLVTLASMYCEGKSLRSIAHYFEVDESQVRYDLNIVRKRWGQLAKEALDEHRARELAKLDHLESTYWEAWERSTQERTETLTEQVDAITNRRRAVVRRRGRDGNAFFLQGVFQCIDRRIKLLGLDAPTKVDLVQHVKSLGLDDEMTAAVLAEAQEILRGGQ